MNSTKIMNGHPVIAIVKSAYDQQIKNIQKELTAVKTYESILTARSAATMEHYRKIGEILKQIRYGFDTEQEWELWFTNGDGGQLNFGPRQAKNYMRVASNWDTVKSANSIRHAMSILGVQIEPDTQKISGSALPEQKISGSALPEGKNNFVSGKLRLYANPNARLSLAPTSISIELDKLLELQKLVTAAVANLTKLQISL